MTAIAPNSTPAPEHQALVFNHPAIQRQRLRAKIEAAVDRLIAMLDAIDAPFEDLEDTDEDEQCDDEGAREEDDDTEHEASLCGVEFGAPAPVFRYDPVSECMHYDLEEGAR